VDATRLDNAQCLESVRPLNLYRHSASLRLQKTASYRSSQSQVN
jgi:hypothetical protein